MGARPSSFKKGGGGFLNNVDGTITGYEFTDVFPSDNPKPRKKSDFHSLYCILSVRVDGADEDVSTTLFVGSADEWEIENDGHTLVPNEEGQEIGQNTGFGKLLSSLTEANFPEAALPEDEFNWEAIIGTRCRFVQRTDKETTQRLGKRKGKNGKEYDRQDLVIDQVYDLPGEAGKAAKAGKAAPKGKAGKTEDAEDDDVETLATKFLLKMVTANKGKLTKGKLSMGLLKPEFGMSKHPLREEVRALFKTDKFLNTEDGWSYNEDKELITVKAKADEDEEEED